MKKKELKLDKKKSKRKTKAEVRQVFWNWLYKDYWEVLNQVMPDKKRI